MAPVPIEILKKIFSYTKIENRRALQSTCKDFRDIGNIPGVLERQIINTCEGLPPALRGAAPDPTPDHHTETQDRSPSIHLLLAGIMKVVPSQCLKTLRGHTGKVNGLTRLDNGQLASCSDDMTIRIWNPETGECLKTLSQDGPDKHSDGVRHITFLGDKQLASCSDDQTIKIWGYGIDES